MWKLKSCPRCRGDMFIERDGNTWFEHCLLCSYRSELKSLDKTKERPVESGAAGKSSDRK